MATDRDPGPSVEPTEQRRSPFGRQSICMPDPARHWSLAVKIMIFDWLMTHVPPLRRYRAEHETLIARLAHVEDELQELQHERDALLHGMSRLLDERASRTQP